MSREGADRGADRGAVTEGVVTGAGPRRLIIASVAVAVFMARLDIYVVNVSLPTIGRDFAVGTSAVAWVVMGYLLLSSGSMMLIGHIADRAGPRRLFVLGYAVFTVGSLLCGLAPSLGLLVAFRCLQGLGGAFLVIMTYTVVSRFLPAATVGGAMGVLATCGALGIAVGSPLGGFLTEHLSWRWVFFVNVPIGVAAMALALRAIPGGGGPQARRPGERRPGEHRPGERRPRLDYPGVVLSFAAVASFVLALSLGQQGGWGRPRIVGLFVVAVACAALFVMRQRRAADPLVPPGLLRSRPFLLANAVCVFGLILMGGNAFLMPFFLELFKGLSTDEVGLLLLVYSVTFMALSPLTGRLADRFAPWRLCAAGMAVGTAACTALAWTMGAAGLAAVVVFLLALGLVYALFMAANAKQVLEAAPRDQRGAASAVFGTLYALSLLLGVSVFEALYAGAGAAAGSAGTASAAAAPASSAGSGRWVAGFSPAYLVGAGACALALLLCFTLPLVERRRAGSAAPTGAHGPM